MVMVFCLKPIFIKIAFLLNDPGHCHFLYNGFPDLLFIFKSLLEAKQEVGFLSQ